MQRIEREGEMSKWYTENIPQCDTANNQFYSFKKNVKALSVIGIESIQAYFPPMVRIHIDNIYFDCLVGKIIYFPDNRFIENIAINVLYYGGVEIPTKATIIFTYDEN
jgi:hypothetical protein